MLRSTVAEGKGQLLTWRAKPRLAGALLHVSYVALTIDRKSRAYNMDHTTIVAD